MTITVHRGTLEVGGTCIEVATAGTRLVLDLGLPLVDADREPFDSFKALRSTREQLLADGTIRPVPGLFTDDAPAPDAVLLSHAHLDHTGLLHHSRPAVPVYATTGTGKMMLAGRPSPATVTAPSPRADPSRSAASPPPRSRSTTAPSAASPTCSKPAGDPSSTPATSGDLRRHGRKPGMARTLIDRVAPMNVDALLMEGTHLGGDPRDEVGEFDLEERVVELVRSAPALVLAAFSPQDVDRLVTLYRAARRSDRTFVADAYTAFVLHLVAGEAHIPRPTRGNGIRVFFNAAFRRKGLDRLERLFAPDRIELDEVLASPSRHLMAFRPSMTTLDLDNRLPDQVRLLYGYWPGYQKNPDWVALRRQVEAAGGDFVPAHASGHIHPGDLRELVTALNAKTVIPVHTFEPELFCDLFPNTALLSDGKGYFVARPD